MREMGQVRQVSESSLLGDEGSTSGITHLQTQKLRGSEAQTHHV